MKTVTCLNVVCGIAAFTCVSLSTNAQTGGRSEPRAITLARANATIKERFSSVGSVRELQDGRILVADNRDNLVYIADFAGNTSVREVARHGKGPGEYQTVGRLWPLGGDSTLMLEPMARRGLIFNSAQVVSTLTPTSPLLTSIARPLSIFLGRDAKGAVLAQIMSFGKNGPNPADSMMLIRTGPGALTADTLSRMSSVIQVSGGPETQPNAEGGGSVRHNPQYRVSLRSRDQSAQFPDGAVAILHSNPYRIDWCMPTGGCRQGTTIEPADRKMSNEAKEAIILWLSQTNVTLAGRKLGETTGWPEKVPAFVVGGGFDDTAVLADPRGNLLVERVPTTSPALSTYDIVDRSSKRIAVLRLEIQRRVVGFGKNSVFTVEINKDGLQSLQRHDWTY